MGPGWAWNQFATFEAGLTTPYPTGFDAVTTLGAGAVAANAAAAIRGNYGFQITVAGVGSQGWGRLTDPNAETLMTFEFLMNLNNLPMGLFEAFNFIFLPSPGAGGQFVIVNLVQGAADYQFQINGRNDAGANVTNGGKNIGMPGADPFQVRMLLKASSAVGANDGFIRTYVDGDVFDELNFLDNDTQSINQIEIGARGGVDAGTGGTFYLDDIRWANRLI